METGKLISELASLTELDKKSIARSYWHHCYRNELGPCLSQEDVAFYLTGWSQYHDGRQKQEALDRVKSIPLMSKKKTINLLPGLVRSILRDYVSASISRETGAWMDRYTAL